MALSKEFVVQRIYLWKTENFKCPPTAQILSKNDLWTQMVTNFSIHEKLKIKHVHDTAINDDVQQGLCTEPPCLVWVGSVLLLRLLVAQQQQLLIK